MRRKTLAFCILICFSDGLTIIGTYSDQLYVDKTGKIIAPYDVGY
jgi:hypothetical protein